MHAPQAYAARYLADLPRAPLLLLGAAPRNFPHTTTRSPNNNRYNLTHVCKHGTPGPCDSHPPGATPPAIPVPIHGERAAIISPSTASQKRRALRSSKTSGYRNVFLVRVEDKHLVPIALKSRSTPHPASTPGLTVPNPHRTIPPNSPVLPTKVDISLLLLLLFWYIFYSVARVGLERFPGTNTQKYGRQTGRSYVPLPPCINRLSRLHTRQLLKRLHEPLRRFHQNDNDNNYTTEADS